MKMNQTLRLLAILSTAFAAAASHAEQRTYKWIDADGNVTYSNRMPPESTRHERKVINKHGRVVKIYSAPLTDEEKVEQQRLAELAAKKKERARKRAIHDRSLLATYSNSKDMEKARDDKISLINSLIHLTKSRIKSMQQRLLTLSEEAAQFERSGQQLPFTLHSQITNLRDQIAHNKQFTKDKLVEIQDAVDRLNTVKTRIKVLGAEKEALENDVKIAMGEASQLIGLDGHTLATWKTQESKRLDQKAVKAALGDELHVYQTITKSRVLRIK